MQHYENPIEIQNSKRAIIIRSDICYSSKYNFEVFNVKFCIHIHKHILYSSG